MQFLKCYQNLRFFINDSLRVDFDKRIKDVEDFYERIHKLFKDPPKSEIESILKNYKLLDEYATLLHKYGYLIFDLLGS